jgi:hypothetical protein
MFNTAGTMSNNDVNRTDKTLLRIIVAVILAVVINAGITAWAVTNMQNRFNNAAKAQQQQGQVVLSHLCTTLESLYADKPPAGASPSDPSRLYLQELHQRLGDLAVDLKC